MSSLVNQMLILDLSILFSLIFQFKTFYLITSNLGRYMPRQATIGTKPLAQHQAPWH